MKSPFPGMDPYLESRWGDVHVSLLTYISDRIQGQLASDLVARIADPPTAVSPSVINANLADDDERGFGEASDNFTDSISTGASKPLLVFDEPVRIPRHIQILNANGDGSVVTVIEVLCQSNKLTRRGRWNYYRRQDHCLSADINLVEIDLLRCGRYVLALDLELIHPEKRLTYMMCVKSTDLTAVYGASLRQPLPTLPVPLRWREKEVVLELQAIVDLVYERGRYWKLDYSQPLDPPLSDDDAQWANEVLQKAGKRGSAASEDKSVTGN